MKIEIWSRSPYRFLTDCCWTMDEADQGKVKRFPEKPHIRVIADRWLRYDVLLVPKSRRMMCTWTFLALHLWAALFHGNSAIFIQSKKAEDSQFLLGEKRLLFLYRNLPAGYPWAGIERAIKGKNGYDRLYFDNGSYIYAVAQGADQLRQYTASYIYATELAFWDYPQSTWRAMKPTLEGGGKVAIDSSAGPGFFKDLVYGFQE